MQKSSKNIFQRGYTLIEMVIVLVIVSLLLPAIFTILFVILQQQLKIYRIIEVKRQGDYVLSFMKSQIISNAAKIVDDTSTMNELCDTVGETSPSNNGQTFIFITKKTNLAFNFYSDSDGTMWYQSEAEGTLALTTPKVVVTDVQFECTRKSSFGGPLVVINFKMAYNNDGATNLRVEETAEFTYSSKVRLRPY